MNLSREDLDEVSHTLIDIAREAAALLRAGWHTGVEVEHKGSKDHETKK